MFNSIAVPDPEQFNSADFNREAFIAEAKQSNDKLVAQMFNSSQHQISPYYQTHTAQKRPLASASSSNASPISNSSASSSYASPSPSSYLTSHEITNEEEFYTHTEDQAYSFSSNKRIATSKSSKRSRTESSGLNVSVENPNTHTPPKYTSFSINSILVKDEKKAVKSPFNYYVPTQNFNQSMPLLQSYIYQQAALNNNNNYIWPSAVSSTFQCANQMSLFYNYLSHFQQKQC